MKRSNCFVCCATCNLSKDALSKVSLGQFSLHLSTDFAEQLGRVAQYTGWTPLNYMYRRKCSQRVALHPATLPDFTILCSILSQHVCYVDWINLWSLPSQEELPIILLSRLLPMLQHNHHRIASSIIKVQYLNLDNPMLSQPLPWYISQCPAASSAYAVG